MSFKTIFLCETNHDDQAMRMAEGMLLKKLINYCYNQIYLEWDDINLNGFYELLSNNYNHFSKALGDQLIQLFKLSHVCVQELVDEDSNSIDSAMQLHLNILQALQNKAQLHPFEVESRMDSFEEATSMCEILSDKKIISHIVFNIYKDYFDNINSAEKKRYLDIVNSLAKIHSSTKVGDKNIVLAGVNHCVDFYNHIRHEKGLKDVLFIQLKSNLIEYKNPDFGDAVLIDGLQQNGEFVLDYTCGESKSKTILDNFHYLGVNFDTLPIFNDEEDDDMICQLKYNDYNLDQTNVVRFDININHIDSYHSCLHNVTNLLQEAA